MLASRSKKKMWAAVLVAPRKMDYREVDLPAPADDEVRIALEGCGVCASNLARWEGTPWAQYPLEPGEMGHEAWGRVEAKGKNVQGFSEGDRVAGLTYHSYAEYDIAKPNSLVKIPDFLQDDSFPGEALGCAMNIFKRAQIRAGQTVAIIGIGFLGALLTQLASRSGARVIAISRRPFSLEIAKLMGASHLIPMEDHNRIIEEVKTLTNGNFCDCVIEAVGKQWPLDLAGEVTKTRGRLVIAGYHQDGPRQVNMQLWNWRGFDVVNAHERDSQIYLRGIQDAIEAIHENRLNPKPLYTHTFDLKETGEALEATLNRPDGFLKALVVYR